VLAVIMLPSLALKLAMWILWHGRRCRCHAEPFWPLERYLGAVFLPILGDIQLKDSFIP
jgi:hypothetical protein